MALSGEGTLQVAVTAHPTGRPEEYHAAPRGTTPIISVDRVVFK